MNRSQIIALVSFLVSAPVFLIAALKHSMDMMGARDNRIAEAIAWLALIIGAVSAIYLIASLVGAFIRRRRR